MHRFRIYLLSLILIVLLWTQQQARAQENFQQQESPIFEFENRFDLSIELGPAFIRGPVLKQSEFFAGTRLMYEQPRYLGLEFSQRVLRYLRLGWGVNFTSVNIKEAQEFGVSLFAITGFENDVIRAQPEYATALRIDDCDYSCALAAAITAINGDQARREAVNALLNAKRNEISQIPDRGISAQGTFFALDSFLSIYADYPIFRNFSIYGGGGVGLSWSQIRKGEVDQNIFFNLLANTQSNSETAFQSVGSQQGQFNNTGDIIIEIEEDETIQIDELSGGSIGITQAGSTGSQQGGPGITVVSTGLQQTLLNIDALAISIEPINLVIPPRSISYSSLSYSVMAAVGFRMRAFESLTIDTGYRMIWTPDLYSSLYIKDGRGQLIHQVRLGFVFNF